MPDNRYKNFTPEARKAAMRAVRLKNRPLRPVTPYTPEERKAARAKANALWASKNKERIAERNRAWKAANPAKMKAQYLRRLPKQLQYNTKARMKVHGLTPADYDRMFEKQHGVCAICFRPSDIMLAIDHCHKTNRVRGLLCGSCNRGIGLLQDDPDTLISAAAYLHDAVSDHLKEMLG